MKIAITAEQDNISSMLDPRFGRGKYFVIYNTDTDKIEKIINNNDNVEIQGGAGTSAAQKIADEDAEAIISGNFGPNASKGLNAFGIKMYSAEPDRLQNVITRFKKGELTLVNEATVAGHH